MSMLPEDIFQTISKVIQKTIINASKHNKSFNNHPVYKNAAGQLHREDGPAFVSKNGAEYWCNNGILTRENGPAIINTDKSMVTEYWFQNGLLHRENGPAFHVYNIPIDSNGGISYFFLGGVQYTRTGYYQQLYKLGKISDLECFMELL